MVNGAKQLAAFLKRSGVSHAAFAARIGRTRSMVSHLVAGRTGPSLALALAIERQTGIPAASWGTPTKGRA